MVDIKVAEAQARFTLFSKSHKKMFLLRILRSVLVIRTMQTSLVIVNMMKSDQVAGLRKMVNLSRYI